MNGLRDVRGTLMVLTAFQKSKEVLYPEPQRGQWLSGHLDRSFSKEVDDYALSSILEVACSKGLDYISRVYGDLQCVWNSLAEKKCFSA